MFLESNVDFYIDPEIYHCNANFSQSVISEAKIFSFPTKDKGAYAASLPLDGAISNMSGSLSVGPSWVDSEDLSKPISQKQRPVVTSTVSSEQVAKFWEIYQAYPKYLKNVQKRQKRKNKKKSFANI